jgi:hypothetical protein
MWYREYCINWWLHQDQGEGTPLPYPTVPNTEVCLVQYKTDLGHQIIFNNTGILARKSRCMHWLMKEALRN